MLAPPINSDLGGPLRPGAAFIAAQGVVPVAGFAGVLSYCRFDIGRFSDRQFEHLGIALPAALETGRRKRRAEFLAGRYCARLAQLQLRGEAADVGRGRGGQPAWPEGLRGAISHCGPWAVSAVARQQTYRGIGVDLEASLSFACAGEISELVASAEEIARVEACGLPVACALRLIFSAKESLFKALYPHVGTYFDFLDASVEAIDRQRQQLTLRLLRSLAPEAAEGSRFCCRYGTWAGQILTLLAYQEPPEGR